VLFFPLVRAPASKFTRVKAILVIECDNPERAQGACFARPRKLEDTLAYRAASDAIVNIPVRKTG
jgi:hypothetical protein